MPGKAQKFKQRVIEFVAADGAAYYHGCYQEFSVYVSLTLRAKEFCDVRQEKMHIFFASLARDLRYQPLGSSHSTFHLHKLHDRFDHNGEHPQGRSPKYP